MANAQLLLMLTGTGSAPGTFADPERMCPAPGQHPPPSGVRRQPPPLPGRALARTEAPVPLRAAARRLPGVRFAAEAAGEPPMLGLLSFGVPLKVAVERLLRMA
ncbi:hypothetical protein ACWEWX_36970 [Streptomyces asiaticus]